MPKNFASHIHLSGFSLYKQLNPLNKYLENPHIYINKRLAKKRIKKVLNGNIKGHIICTKTDNIVSMYVCEYVFVCDNSN